MYSCKGGDDGDIKLKGISKWYLNHIKFEDNKKCSGGEEHQKECDNYILKIKFSWNASSTNKKINSIYIRW